MYIAQELHVYVYVHVCVKKVFCVVSALKLQTNCLLQSGQAYHSSPQFNQGVIDLKYYFHGKFLINLINLRNRIYAIYSYSLFSTLYS